MLAFNFLNSPWLGAQHCFAQKKKSTFARENIGNVGETSDFAFCDTRGHVTRVIR